MFPVFYGFKGGKGILCSGTLLLLLDWRIALVGWGAFVVLWLTTRYVSLGSVAAAVSLPFTTYFVFHNTAVGAPQQHQKTLKRYGEQVPFPCERAQTGGGRMNIVVLGSGGWGTAAAMLLSDNGHTVALWSHDPKKAELLDKTRENPLLKGVRIPERIAITSDLAVLQNAEMAVFAPEKRHAARLAHEGH